ncbi:DUF3520 domain-containing protein [Roseomonas frigidaquae]|uniref:DUF3520 domain-containing protein n=1 Tax=Falsiroseomonas frigidaquae TaxID=487318 RepID=A0ABX1F5M0_9PROT|nr:von Willebrand factor type A domain-containing protein [Falsiroseomonas frigidaquae]NKE47637.1 DUF3520 domain-containing protein [Falsiroseomonas frigidaquae]
MTTSARRLLGVLLPILFLAACEATPPGNRVPIIAAPAPAAMAPAAMAPAAPARGGPARGGPALPPQPAPERMANLPEQSWQSAVEAPVSTFSIGGDTASYTLTRRLLESGVMPQPVMVRPEEFLNAFDYGYPRPTSPQDPIATFVSVHPSPWNAERRLVHIGLRAWQPPVPQARRRLNLVMLVDVSGSMESQDRLPLLQRGLAMMLPELRAEDRVSLVVYAGGVQVVLDSVPGDQRDRIAAALEGLRAGGGTAGGAALATAYSLAGKNLDPAAINRVVLATDGDFNIGIRTPAEMKDFISRERQRGIYLTTIGVGLDNYNDRTLHALARAGNGTAIYAGSLQDLRRGLVEDFAANIVPAADDVKAQVEFNPAVVSHYRLIGYETRQLSQADFRNDQVDAGELGSGRSVTAIYEIVPIGGARPPVEPLRYAAPLRPAPRATQAAEIAFLRVAYKRPGQRQSRELGRAITPRDQHASFDAAPEAARFAAAVAGFAQLLRRSPHTGDWGFTQAAAVAAAARGVDEDGRRAEFIALLRLAAARYPMGPR